MNPAERRLDSVCSVRSVGSVSLASATMAKGEPFRIVGHVADARSLHEALGVIAGRFPGWKLVEVVPCDGHAELVIAVDELFLVVSVSEIGAVREAMLLDARPDAESLRAVRRDPTLRQLTVLSMARTAAWEGPRICA